MMTWHPAERYCSLCRHAAQIRLSSLLKLTRICSEVKKPVLVCHYETFVTLPACAVAITTTVWHWCFTPRRNPLNICKPFCRERRAQECLQIASFQVSSTS